MEKFIEFNGGVLNTRYIIEMEKFTRFGEPQYCIIMKVTGGERQQWFNEEYERDVVFNQLSSDLLNE